jgi:excisionase family DNA binding protein
LEASTVSSNVIPLARTAPRTWPADDPDAAPAPVVSIGACAVYTVTEVAHMLSLSRGSAYQLVRTGEIPALKLGGRWVIPKRRFPIWLDNLPDPSTDDLDRELRREEARANRHPRTS